MRVVFLIFFLFPIYSSLACTTPVFQYAMQMWEQDYYNGLLIYDGTLTAEEEKILKSLQEAINQNIALNLSLQKIDIASEKRTLKKLLGKNIPEQLPALVLWYPWQMGYAPPFWSGSLSEQVVKQIIQSPKRTEIGNHLLRGVPIVWFVVKSGDEQKDQDAIKSLEEELSLVKAEILADSTFNQHFEYIKDRSNLFPIVVLSDIDAPEERVLRSMISKYYPGLEEINEPVVFPVFGRGRVLAALVGEEIEEYNIQEVIAFLLNPCSCEVKMANPGYDLLISSDWNTLVSRMDQAPLRPRMSGILPEASIEYDFDNVIELTGGERGFFKSRILSTTGIIISIALICIIVASIIIIKRN